MPIRFICSKCHQRLSVRSEKAGQQVKCPTCRQVVLAPTEAAAVESAVPPDESAISSDEPAVSPDENRPPPPVSEPWSEFAVYDRDDEFVDELVYLQDASRANPADQHDPDLVTFPRRVLYLQGFLLGFVALLFFVFGIIVGSRSVSQPSNPAAAQPCVVYGQVTFTDAQDREKPDDGSAVFLVPSRVRPDEKILIEGLRVDDPPPTPGDRCVTMLHDLGGNLARVDARGRFRMRLPAAGRYFLLVISRNASRLPGSQPAPQDLAEIGRYFVPASELLDTARYEWREVLIESDRQIDTVF